jgi:hypothetical protein
MLRLGGCESNRRGRPLPFIAHDIAELARGIAPRPSSYACRKVNDAVTGLNDAVSSPNKPSPNPFQYVLASRERRMSPPLARYPERFHEERSEIAHDIAGLARRVAPRTRRATSIAVDISEGRRGRIVVAAQTINGKRVMVQRRRAFAVYVGERPVKPD